MQIRISIEKTEPLEGWATAGASAAVPFVGWLEMLRTISELVGTDDRAVDRDRTGEEPMERTRGDQNLS